MDSPLRDCLLRQFDITWRLTERHLTGLSLDEGAWIADWPETEGYDIGPSSIAWLTWHLGFWWSMALDWSFGDATLERAAVSWPGDPNALRLWLFGLHQRWRDEVERISDADLASDRLTLWPFKDRPFGDVIAWANIELMKSAAEIGYARFLFAARNPSQPDR